ncbi:MAG: hypothetical protein ACE5EE_00875 [Fidelibacterota bacterium]
MRNILITYLITLTTLSAGVNRFVYRPEFHNSLLKTQIEKTEIKKDSTTQEKYPAKGLLYSLVLPGAGQWYAGAKWKSLLFVSVEVTTVIIWSKMKQKGMDVKSDFESLADNDWLLNQWWEKMNILPPELGISAMGSHEIQILLTDGSIIGSNEDTNGDSIPDWTLYEVDNVIRDRDFYENIGKYNQFVGGWSDIDSFWVEGKSVGDSTEWLVMTKNRDKYLDLRQDHNRFLQLASYAISTVMFNHIISAIDAVWETRRRSQPTGKVETSIYPSFSTNSKYGIGGISLSLQW